MEVESGTNLNHVFVSTEKSEFTSLIPNDILPNVSLPTWVKTSLVSTSDLISVTYTFLTLTFWPNFSVNILTFLTCFFNRSESISFSPSLTLTTPFKYELSSSNFLTLSFNALILFKVRLDSLSKLTSNCSILVLSSLLSSHCLKNNAINKAITRPKKNFGLFLIRPNMSVINPNILYAIIIFSICFFSRCYQFRPFTWEYVIVIS